VDQNQLNHIRDQLRSNRAGLGTPADLVARLRRSGHSPVAVIYIVSQVFDLSLSQTKALLLATEPPHKSAQIADFHATVERDARG
jgi:hypothetical protein